MIAANLVVDGILTTFVASARDSSIEPLAQRARKILQEEGAHRVHAEAWLRRLCRARPATRAAAASASGRCGNRRRAGPAPTITPATGPAIEQGMVREGPDAVRGRVRDWLAGLLAAESVTVELSDPSDWSDWDEEHRR